MAPVLRLAERDSQTPEFLLLPMTASWQGTVQGVLYPWFCALFIDENHRGNGYGRLLIEKAGEDARKAGFAKLYLCTDPVGYYEKYGFCYLGEGYHPWGVQSRIYGIDL